MIASFDFIAFLYIIRLNTHIIKTICWWFIFIHIYILIHNDKIYSALKSNENDNDISQFNAAIWRWWMKLKLTSHRPFISYRAIIPYIKLKHTLFSRRLMRIITQETWIITFHIDKLYTLHVTLQRLLIMLIIIIFILQLSSSSSSHILHCE